MVEITSSEKPKKEMKPKKPLWKKWWFWLTIIFVIFIIIGVSGGGKKETQEQSQTPEQKFSFENYIHENKIREYEIVKEEDITIKALGDKKLSDYSAEELAKLPDNFRMKYQIIVPSDITLEELESTLAQVIKEKSTANSDIDEIAVQAWESKESLKGGNPALGYAEWCPYGNWAGVTPEIAKNNVRDSYKIVYNIDKKALEVIKRSKEETLFGLSEATRKEVFKELVRCEDRGEKEAMKRYLQGCEACPEFIVADAYKYADKSTELINNCKEKIRGKYNITEEIESKISVEGIEKRWPMPEPLPSPGCCK